MGTNINAAKRYSDIPLPFTCPINQRYFNSTQGLATYISRTLKMDHKEYYDKYIHHRDSSCFFCGGEGLFMSVGKGYRNLCQNSECLKKSFVSHSVEGIMYRDLISREEAELKFLEKNTNQLEKRTQTFEKLRTDDKDWDKKRSRNCKEFYLNKGFTEEESINKSKEVMDDIHKKTFKKFKDDPEKYASKNPTKIEYYLKKGFSMKESMSKLSERQTTFSKDICIEKYGEEDGLKIWKDRQSKWQDTLLKNGNIKGGYSKISQKLFNDILNTYKKKNIKNLFFWTKNNEIVFKYDTGFFMYDFTDIEKKKIIEYNGDQYHANPAIYEADSKSHPYFKHNGLTAADIWQKDKKKIDLAKSKGYDVLVIWDSDYNKDPNKEFQKCLDFLNT